MLNSVTGSLKPSHDAAARSSPAARLRHKAHLRFCAQLAVLLGIQAVERVRQVIGRRRVGPPRQRPGRVVQQAGLIKGLPVRRKQRLRRLLGERGGALSGRRQGWRCPRETHGDGSFRPGPA